MKKSFLKILATSLLVSFIFSSIAYARPSKDEVQKIVKEASANMTDEQKAMIESQIFQVAYKVMDTAISKSLLAIDKVNTKLDDENLQIPPETKTMIEDSLSGVEKLLIEEQSKLKNADSLSDLKVIQEDLVNGLTENAQNVQKIFLDKAQDLIVQADAALTALEKTCGADVSSQKTQLDTLSKQIDSYQSMLESGDTMTKEELQTKLQEMDPEEIQSQMQSLAGDIQDLQSECPTAQ